MSFKKGLNKQSLIVSEYTFIELKLDACGLGRRSNCWHA